jgi:Ni/Co efflux regulator RcnB
MRNTILSAALVASSAVAVAAPASAQSAQQQYNREVRQAEREYQRDLRQADDQRDVRQARREYRRDVRDARRDYRQFNRYDYNRFEPGQRGYYADQYYRDGNYRPRYLTRNDRLYRGGDGRYYCRRTDGTTGLIVGGLAGGVLGNLIAPGGSNLIGTLLGAGGGALLGRSIDRRQVVCR